MAIYKIYRHENVKQFALKLIIRIYLNASHRFIIVIHLIYIGKIFGSTEY